MADFKQAFKWGLDGKKTHTGFVWYMVMEEYKIVFRWKENNELSGNQELQLNNIEATDWEIYEEEKCFKCANERGDILPLRSDGRIILCKEHEEDNWNLSNFKCAEVDKSERICYSEKVIKTFIQKIKEDIKKESYCASGDRCNCEAIITQHSVKEIIKKRVGKL